jgi:general secretion pathway protein L
MPSMLLVIELSGTEHGFAFALASAEKNVTRFDRAAPALLPRATEVVAAVPPDKLSWLLTAVPKGKQRVRAVLDGLLEDRLLADPAKLHLAHAGSAPGTDGQTWVAVCDKAWIESQLQTLQTAGIQVQRVVPMLEPLPDGGKRLLAAPNHIGQAIWWHASSTGVMAWPVAHALPEGLLTDETTLQSTSDCAQAAEAAAGRAVAVIQHAQWLVQAASSTVDLAQFDLMRLAGSNTAQRVKRLGAALLQAPEWRWLRVGAAGVLITQLVGFNAMAWQESRSLAAKANAQTAVLKETFPQTSVIVDAPLQMQRALAAQRETAGTTAAGDLESLLAVAAALGALQQAPTGMAYAQGQLTLTGAQLDATASANAAAKAQAMGYVLDVKPEGLVLRPASAQAGNAAVVAAPTVGG